MTWRSVMISQPSYLKLKDNALVVEQAGELVSVPLEDINVILLDNPQITLTAPLLSECAARQVSIITTGKDHHPNGTLLPFLPHSRALQIQRLQLAQSQPRKKRLWQTIVKQKIINQAATLSLQGHAAGARKLEHLAGQVRSGDSTNQDAVAAHLYFIELFGKGFNRRQESRINSMLNYGYAVIRAVLAKYLVSYGFLTSLGLHHRNERNSFNLADDLIEPFRPILDCYCIAALQTSVEEELTAQDKSLLLGFLHEDVATVDIAGEITERTVLSACEALVVSSQQRLRDDLNQLHLPVLMA